MRWERSEFFIDTLKPEVDSQYRTISDPANTMIEGSCRNGTFVVYAAFSRLDVFLKAIVLSPVVWLAEGGGPWLSNNQLIKSIKNTEAPFNLRIYLDIGTNESGYPQPNVFNQDRKRITYTQANVESANQLYLT